MPNGSNDGVEAWQVYMEYKPINCGKEGEGEDDDGAKSMNEFRSMFDK